MQALESNRALTACNMASNSLTEYGGLAWADTLWSNKALRSLTLSDNPLGDEVAVNIAGVLAVNSTLQVPAFPCGLPCSAGASRYVYRVVGTGRISLLHSRPFSSSVSTTSLPPRSGSSSGRARSGTRARSPSSTRWKATPR